MHELMAADQQKEHPPDVIASELRSPPSVELTLTLTPDTAAALLAAITPQIVKLWEVVKGWIDQTVKALGKVMAAIGKTTAATMRSIMDAMLYTANEHPKWWYLYKHAKKYRVRKKYRRRLEKQLYSKLLAAASG